MDRGTEGRGTRDGGTTRGWTGGAVGCSKTVICVAAGAGLRINNPTGFLQDSTGNNTVLNDHIRVLTLHTRWVLHRKTR